MTTSPSPALQDDLLLGRSLIDPQSRTSERDLVLPILLAAAKAEQIGLEGETSSQLFRALVPLESVSDADRAPGRADRKNVSTLQQTFRNAFSHGLFDGLLDPSKFEQAGQTQEGYRISLRGMAKLLEILLQDAPELRKDEVLTVVPGATRVIEDMVARQILVRLAELQAGEDPRAISITALRKDVKSELPLSLMDIQLLKGRNDTRIDQVIRNVISNNTLTRPGLVTRDPKGLIITDKGRAVVLDFFLETMSPPDFGISPTPRVEFQARVDLTLAKHAEKIEARRSKPRHR
jgi:hypothetical protein